MNYEIKDENNVIVDSGKLNVIETEEIGRRKYSFDAPIRIENGQTLTIIPEMIHET
jgi:hypothetical protein